ncbi:MAG: BlaI/MecI/CopY family transcriptional regulator [Candidatus Eisenbacteria bacterium]
MPRPLPTGAQELAVLRHVAEHGPIAVSRVVEAFAAELGLARSTVLTVMERLRRKGHLSRRRVDGVYVYESALSEQHVLSRALGQFVDRALQGSVSPIAAYLTERGEVSEAELRALKAAVRALKAAPAEDE